MCTFNGERYLRQQLDSINGQIRPPDELVISDDRSSDSTLSVINSFRGAASFPVRVSVNDQTIGSTRNFEQAISLCGGDIIALADQDDVWLPNKLASLEAEFRKDARIGLVFSDAEVVDQELRPTGRRMWAEVGFCEREKHLVKHGRALDVFLPGWSVTGATMAFRSSFRQLLLPIPTNLPMIHDGWIALILAAVSKVRFIDAPLILYRQHAQQQIGAPVKRDRPPSERLTKIESLKEAANRQNTYEDLIKIIDEVRRRLNSPSDDSRGEAVDYLAQRREHLWARMQLPSSAAARLPVVLGELFSLRYWRFSNGITSAVKDLFVGRGQHRKS